MKKLLIMLTAMVVSLSAVAGGEHCDGAAEDCMAKMQAKYAAKPWLGVEYDKGDHGQYVIKTVHADSPAEAAGFQKGDRIVTAGGNIVRDVIDLTQKVDEYEAGDTGTVEVIRGEERLDLEVTYDVIRHGR